MEITQEEWNEWKSNKVTKEWFSMLEWRKQEYEKRLPDLLTTPSDEAIQAARVAAGRVHEIFDLLQTRYEDMKNGD
jgi:hypothetical protein